MEPNGIILIDKPSGFTSFDVVAVLRGVLGTKKVGHTGTLDPMATGVLPVLCGRSTKLCDMMPSGDKRYTAVMRLGITTDTLDITGTVLTESKVDVGLKDVTRALPQFTGDIMQRPPMYSAVKIGGKKLYELARSGKEVDRPERPVSIYSLNLISHNEAENEYTLDIECSKGTYIRSLVDDLGKILGCGATLTQLRRTAACGFLVEECIPLEKARTMTAQQLVIPCDRALTVYDPLTVSDAQANRFLNGGALDIVRTKLPKGFSGTVRMYAPDGEFLGLAVSDDENHTLKCGVLLK